MLVLFSDAKFILMELAMFVSFSGVPSWFVKPTAFVSMGLVMCVLTWRSRRRPAGRWRASRGASSRESFRGRRRGVRAAGHNATRRAIHCSRPVGVQARRRAQLGPYT